MASKKKMAMPAAALEFFQTTGAQGGRAKVPKGLATMSPEKQQKVRAAALKTRLANAKKRGEAGKKAGGAKAGKTGGAGK